MDVQDPQDPQTPVDPWIAAARRAAPRRPAARNVADPWVAAARAAAPDTTSAAPAVVPNDTTLGPEGIRANDTTAVRSYLDSAAALSRRVEARQESTATAPQASQIQQMRLESLRHKPSLPLRAAGAALSYGKPLVDMAAGTLGTMAKQYATLQTGDPLGFARSGAEVVNAIPQALGAWGKAVEHARAAGEVGDEPNRPELFGTAGNAAFTLLGLLEGAERARGGVRDVVTPTQAAEPRVHVPEATPAEHAANTAEALQGLGEHAEATLPAQQPLGHEAPKVPREEYEAGAAPVVTAPGADQTLRQSEVDPFLEEAYRQAPDQQKAPDVLRTLSDAELAQHPLGATPEKGQAPEVAEEQGAAAMRRLVERQKQEERRQPGDRRLDETTLIDEDAERRQGERRQPDFARSGEERRDLETRPVPQGDERRTEPAPLNFKSFSDTELEAALANAKATLEHSADSAMRRSAQEFIQAIPAELSRRGLGNAASAPLPAEDQHGYAPEPPTQGAEASPPEPLPELAGPAIPGPKVRSTADVGPPETNVPLPSKLDLNDLDARIQAQREANARLQAQVEAIPARKQTPAERIADQHARRLKAEETANAAQKEEQRAENAKHMNLLRERATVQRQIDEARAELVRYGRRGGANPTLRDRIATLKQTISDFGERIADLNTRLGRRGFVVNPFGRSLAEPNVAQRAGLPAEVNAVLDHVAVGERAPLHLNVWDTLHQWFWETSRTARTLERRTKAAGRPLPLSQRPLLWMKAALDSPTRIGGWLLDEGAGPGRWDSKGNWQLTGTPAFETALAPIKGDATKVSLWRARLIAEHAPEIEAAGFDSGIPLADAAKVAAMPLPPDVAKAVDATHAILNDALQYGVDAGAYTPGLQKVLRQTYERYVPFQRAFEGEGSAGRGGSGSPLAPKGPLKKLKGSELNVVDPAETVPDYVARMVRYADVYRAARSTIDLIEAHPDLFEGMAKKVGSTSLKSVGQATQAIGTLLSDRALSLEGDRLVLANPRTGTLDTYKVDPLISDALKGLGSKEYGLALELLGGLPKKALTFGVTNNPVFGLIINPIRDALSRPTMSIATRYPGQGTPAAVSDALLRRPDFKKFRSMGGGFGLSAESGGGMAQLARAAGGRGTRVASQLGSQASAARYVGGRGIRPVGSFVDLLKKISLPAEQAGRFSEFRTVKAKGRSVYGDETMSDLEAHMHTQETMGNFAEHGTAPAMRLLSHVTPFVNPALQGTRAFGAAFRRNPGRFAFAGVTSLTLPTLALYWLNRDDKEIQDLRQSAGGYLYSFARLPSGEIIKAPKPFLAGAVFMTTVEHALDAWREHDPHAFSRGFDDFWKEATPNFLPPLASAAYSLGSNRDIYSSTPIVPNEQQGNLPEYQIGRHPSPTMNRVGQTLGVSPAKLKFGARALGGSSATEILSALDRTLYNQELPAARPADYPFVGRLFGRTPSSAAAPIRDVYNESNAPSSVLTTLQYLARKGQANELQSFIEKHQEELPRSAAAQGFVKALSQLADQAELVEGLPDLSPKDRADLRDEVLRLMTGVADEMHPILDQMARDEGIAKRKP